MQLQQYCSLNNKKTVKYEKSSHLAKNENDIICIKIHLKSVPSFDHHQSLLNAINITQSILSNISDAAIKIISKVLTLRPSQA